MLFDVLNVLTTSFIFDRVDVIPFILAQIGARCIVLTAQFQCRSRKTSIYGSCVFIVMNILNT
jgi:hypothetical protein